MIQKIFSSPHRKLLTPWKYLRKFQLALNPVKQNRLSTSSSKWKDEVVEVPAIKELRPTIRKPQFQIRGKCLGIRREEQSVWERRAPLAPQHVKMLVKRGCKVLVQPSNRRAYPMQAYAQAGAIIQEDLSEADVICGVKQVPIDSLIKEKTFCFFSHTIKAQDANMPLLDAILEKNIRLLDYERMCDDQGFRVVAFGKYAGVAGMINILHGLGLRLLALGHHTPFMHIGPAHNYRNSGMARQAVRDAGYEIALGMMPKSIGPLTFVFTGSGNVSQGAQEVFQELPFEYVPPEMLHKVAEHGATNKVYGCEVRRHDHLMRKDTKTYNARDYEENPGHYLSTFSKKIAPYASVIINGIYWAINSPKLLTLPDAKYLLQPTKIPWLPNSPGSPNLPHRMLAICDISADPGGSIEFMNECTTIDNPFCLYDADRNKDVSSFKGSGVLVCSIDNMPTQLPRESTDFFGELLFPYIPEILQSDARQPWDPNEFSQPISGAIIASNGKLTPNFEYIADLRHINRSKHKSDSIEVGAATNQQQNKRALVLGAGYVSSPLVEYLARDGNNITVTVASALKDEADALASKYRNTEPLLLDVIGRPDLLENLISETDIVISLLPYSLHAKIASECIKHKVDMVTASYCSPQMQELHEAAKEAGVTIVNEVGLDPGIDHLLAVECFDEIHSKGGKVESFVSYCGGLPAPECSDNPLRYKFSWNPRGVLSNCLGGAKYLKANEVIEIKPGGSLVTDDENVHRINFLPGFALEGYANRNSLDYKTLYRIPEAHTVLRGTLRYSGFSNMMKGIIKLGLIDPNPHSALHPKGPEITWRQYICSLLGQMDTNIFYDNLKNLVLRELDGDRVVMEGLEELGLLDEIPVVKFETPIETISHFLNKRLAFDKGERDLVVLRHEIIARWQDGKREFRGINLVVYGGTGSTNNGENITSHGYYSAMAKTVGYPTAIAAKMVLDGEIQNTGMVYPLAPEIYRPMLSRLHAEGIIPTERIQVLEDK
ncbi:unnamed protein product [Orchesella dallaii]|uniref:Saccharopine dehydrogenase (NAD(+), L-glutamate-forming) n=1 Tax=Orchesella dallaii TaxID=48710 RepID=A0ABP1QC00_9HEXA